MSRFKGQYPPFGQHIAEAAEAFRPLFRKKEAQPANTLNGQMKRVAYADPPYPGMSGFYRDHPDYAGEVDHADLIARLETFDGWCLHTASTTLKHVLALAPDGVRVMAWVKPFASFKKNVAVAYAWEPVIVKPCRIREYDGLTTIRDWHAENITLQRGLTGAKPESVCHWLFEAMGMQRRDELHDLFPGTGAVMVAWKNWRCQPPLALSVLNDSDSHAQDHLFPKESE